MSIFKDSFTDKVRDQLKVRGEAFLGRSSTDIIYINGRAAWVRMTSGVDINNSSELARQNVMQGGVLDRFGQINGYDKYDLRQGVGNNFNTNAYSGTTLGSNNLYGLRPMPGITGLDVQSKSAYGSIRTATVTFNCWDIKQLELFELLYMRPGFLSLIEWGWLPYLDNNHGLKNNINFYDIFNKDSKKSLQSRLAEVYDNSGAHDGNYEAILGYVKNYEWSLRPDGGYDCRTEIISTGEILESLKVNYSTNFISTSNLEGGLLFAKEKNQDGISYIEPQYGRNMASLYENNIIAGIASELIFSAYTLMGTDHSKYFQDEDTYKAPEKGNGWIYTDDKGNITGTKGHNLNMFFIDVDSTSGGDDKEKEDKRLPGIHLDKQVYIDLDSFTKILTNWVMPHERTSKTPIVSISTKDRTYYKADKTAADLLCLSHPLQISVDPTICLIKNINFKNINNIKNSIYTPAGIINVIKGEEFITNLAKSTINRYATSGVFDDVDNAKIYFNSYIASAESRKISKVRYGQILANAFEEYKYKNTPNEALTDERSITYRILTTDKKTLIGAKFIEEGKDPTTADDLNAYYSSEITTVSRFSLINTLEENLGTSDTEAILGAQYRTYYVPAADISSAASNIVKTNITNFNLNNLPDLKVENLSFLDKLTKDYFKQTSNGIFGNIGAIYINLNNILLLSLDSGLEANDVKEKREINLYDFIKKLMNQVQGSIGSLNNFEIHADPADGVGRIIDVNYIDEMNVNTAYDNAFTFLSKEATGPGTKFDGLFNNVRSYKITSQIFKEQSSIVAISAQNGGGIFGLDNETLVGFNYGITNRILPDIGPPASSLSYNKSEDQLKLVTTLSSALRSLNTFITDLGWIPGFEWFSQREFNLDNAEKYKNSLRDLIMVYKALTKSDASFKAIIPTIVSLELDGIGGLVIGHMFRLPQELLPAGYKGEEISGAKVGRKLGYIITKLGHRVSNSDWVTQIDAQTIILEDSDQPAFDLNTALTAAGEGAQVNISTGGEINIVSKSGVPYGIVKKETTDFSVIVKQVIDNLEGGYFHPNMLKDGRVMDNRYSTSGETMFGLDRKNSSTRITNSAEGKRFWSIIDISNAVNNWSFNFIPKDPIKKQLLEAATEAIKVDFNYLLNRYVKNPKVKQVIQSDGRLLFNFVYATYNGEGWFEKFAKTIESKYASGITSSDELVKIFVDARIQNKNSLINQTGKKIGALVGIYA
jgi:hypothetical protein